MQTDTTVVILAAGQGTRMKSRMAKVLHRAGGKELIRHAVDAARQIAAPERIFVVTGHQAESVEETLRPAGVQFIRQTEQLGTGHAVMCGESRLAAFPGRLVIFYGDCPLLRGSTLEALLSLHAQTGSGGSLVTTDLADPTGYGRILRDATGGVSAIVEQKAGTPEQLVVREINAGVYCFDGPLFWRHIGEIRPDNAAREYYLTDIVAILLKAGHRISALKLEDSSELLGINNRVELALADSVLRARKVRECLLAGVTVEKPETVSIDSDVQIGMDTVIGPFVQITGRSMIGENCQVGACSIIESSAIGDGVTVAPFSMVSDSAVDAKAKLGPYARLRMGAHVEEGAQVGNFVEIKKSTLGSGSKSMHLAYLGDSTIGSKVNIGAGTITCNYDGKRKHPTTIGDGAFVGSNSTLIAPLNVGRGAYVAAGSVLTDDVPEESLAFGRARQVIKEGWKPKS